MSTNISTHSIKTEAFDDDHKPHIADYDSLTPIEVAFGLRDIIGGKIELWHATEGVLLASCCNAEITSGDEPMLTTYHRRDYRGPATSFVTEDPDGTERQLAKISARFYHTNDPKCLEIALQDPDDLYKVFCRQRNDNEGPSIGESCHRCGGFEMTDGVRHTVQIKNDRDASIRVFHADPYSCISDWFRGIETLRETKAALEGTVTEKWVKLGRQFQMGSLKSVDEIRLTDDEARNVSAQRLLAIGDRAGVWL
jgi:hypothetical protein